MGGKSAENHLRNCLVTTLSNELAKQLTWEGQRQTVGIKSTCEYYHRYVRIFYDFLEKVVFVLYVCFMI